MAADLPPGLARVLGLKPPLATSTRTDLAPTFKLLRSLVDTAFGSPTVRAPEPGLWRKQLQRIAERAGALVEAVWSRFGGKQGLIVDEEGEGGRGVMKLQAVVSDVQMFADSVASQPDPLSSLLLDPVAFQRTSATLASLTKKVASLASHYEVTDELPSPPGAWPEQDALDRAEDLAAIPLLIAKSRPSRDVLRRFEAAADVTSSPTRASLQPAPTRRPEFFRFCYTVNPSLVPPADGDPETALESAVASATALVAANPPPLSLARAGSTPSTPDTGRKSLIQQRIASFGGTSESPPPMPKDYTPRRAASESPAVAKWARTMENRRPSGTWSPSISISPPPRKLSDSRSTASAEEKGVGSFAEQAAAIVAERKRRTASPSFASSTSSRASLRPTVAETSPMSKPLVAAVEAPVVEPEIEVPSVAAPVVRKPPTDPVVEKPPVEVSVPTPEPLERPPPQRIPSSTRVSIISPVPECTLSVRSSVPSTLARAPSTRQPSLAPPSPVEDSLDLGDDLSILDAISAPDREPALDAPQRESDETVKPAVAAESSSLAELVGRASLFDGWKEVEPAPPPETSSRADLSAREQASPPQPARRETKGKEPPSPGASSWATSVISASLPSDPMPTLEGSLRILAIDGGGVRGLSSLFIIRALMDRLKVDRSLSVAPKPCECFDLICGAGTGGIIALLLGRLKLDVESAIDAYISIARDVFGQAKGAIAVLLGKTRYSASKLETAMKHVVQSAAMDPRATLADAGPCRTFVLAMRTSEGSSRTLRSYRTPRIGPDRCSIYQAARATSATPLFFKPIALDDARLASVPNNARLNNPSSVALEEMAILHPGAPVGILVSVGAGRVSAGGDRVSKACAEISAACEAAVDPANCIRLSVPTEGVVREWESVADVAAAAASFMSTVRIDLRPLSPSSPQSSVQTASPLPTVRPAKGLRPSLSLENLAAFTLHDFASTGSLCMPSFE